MTDEKKLREFWIYSFIGGRIQISESIVALDDEYFSPPDYNRGIHPEKVIHVVEFSAYEQAQKRSAELSKLVSSQGIRDMQQLDEIELLKEKLEIATEALEFYSKESNFTVIDEGRNYEHNCVAYELHPDIYGDCNIGTQARQALAKINNNNLTNEGDR